MKEYKAPVKPTFGNINELIKNRPCVAKKDKKKELVKKAKKNKHGVGDEFEALAKSAYRNVDNKGVTAADLAAIDMFARTIYGEMRSCHNDLGERYSKAQARIVLNRAIACQRNKKCGFVDKHDNTKDLSESILSVLGQRQQFSVWNSGDSNLDDILCIQKSKVDRDIWEDAVDIASQAVLDTDKFMNVTRSVGENTYHYISLNAAIDYKEPGWAKSKKKVKGIRIDGLPVDKKSCILAYSSKAIANIQQNLNEKYAAIFNLRGDD